MHRRRTIAQNFLPRDDTAKRELHLQKAPECISFTDGIKIRETIFCSLFHLYKIIFGRDLPIFFLLRLEEAGFNSSPWPPAEDQFRQPSEVKAFPGLPDVRLQVGESMSEGSPMKQNSLGCFQKELDESQDKRVFGY